MVVAFARSGWGGALMVLAVAAPTHTARRVQASACRCTALGTTEIWPCWEAPSAWQTAPSLAREAKHAVGQAPKHLLEGGQLSKDALRLPARHSMDSEMPEAPIMRQLAFHGRARSWRRPRQRAPPAGCAAGHAACAHRAKAELSKRAWRRQKRAPLQAGRPRGHALLLLQHLGLQSQHLQGFPHKIFSSFFSSGRRRPRACTHMPPLAQPSFAAGVKWRYMLLPPPGCLAAQHAPPPPGPGAHPGRGAVPDRGAQQAPPRRLSLTLSSLTILEATWGGSSFTSRLTTASTSASSFSISLISCSTCRGEVGVEVEVGLRVGAGVVLLLQLERL